MFLLGMFIPWANSSGAISGGVTAFIVVAYMSGGSQWSIYNKQLSFPKKPFSIEGCDNTTLAQYWDKLPSMTTVAPEIPYVEF